MTPGVIGLDPGSHDPNPGLQGKSTKKSCDSFKTECRSQIVLPLSSYYSVSLQTLNENCGWISFYTLNSFLFTFDHVGSLLYTPNQRFLLRVQCTFYVPYLSGVGYNEPLYTTHVCKHSYVQAYFMYLPLPKNICRANI